MRTIREILRQKWQLGRSNRAVARSVGLSVGAIGGTLHRARAAGLATWDAVMALPDDALAARLYARGDGAARARPQPDCASIHTERRQPGVTLQLLHLEYLERHPDGYQYTPYCEVYRQWLRRPHDAPGPPRRREEFRRLRGEAAESDRSGDGRAHPRRAPRRSHRHPGNHRHEPFSRRRSGTTTSPTPPSPTRSATASSTPPTASC